jgi:hypothetical protein
MTRSRPVSPRTALKIGAGVVALPLPNIGTPATGENRVLRFMSEVDIPVLDPHWFPGAPTRINAFAVVDTLYGMGGSNKVLPQMVEGAVVEDAGSTRR